MKKIAMVTGATSGIGRACAEAFLKAGYRVIVTARREDKLHEVFDAYGDDCKILCFDVCNRDAAFERSTEFWCSQLDAFFLLFIPLIPLDCYQVRY